MYDSVSQVSDAPGKEDQRYLDRLMRDYKRNGMQMDEQSREKVKSI